MPLTCRILLSKNLNDRLRGRSRLLPSSFLLFLTVITVTPWKEGVVGRRHVGVILFRIVELGKHGADVYTCLEELFVGRVRRFRGTYNREIWVLSLDVEDRVDLWLLCAVQ